MNGNTVTAAGGRGKESGEAFGNWPPDLEMLHRLKVEQDRSFQNIADIYGVTKNAVAGLCHRLDVKSLRRGRKKAAREVEADSAPAIDPHEATGCRYIHGDPRATWSFCQEPQKAESSYCPTHHAACHIPYSQAPMRAAEATFERLAGLAGGTR